MPFVPRSAGKGGAGDHGAVACPHAGYGLRRVSARSWPWSTSPKTSSGARRWTSSTARRSSSRSPSSACRVASHPGRLCITRVPRPRASTDYEVTAGSNLVVITAGVRQHPGESRLDLVGRNLKIFQGECCRAPPPGRSAHRQGRVVLTPAPRRNRAAAGPPQPALHPLRGKQPLRHHVLDHVEAVGLPPPPRVRVWDRAGLVSLPVRH